MVKREIVTLLASTALIVFDTGCATERTHDAVASLTQSDVSRSFVPRELVGSMDPAQPQRQRAVRRDEPPLGADHPDHRGEGGPLSTGRGNPDGLETAGGHPQPGAGRAPGGGDPTSPLLRGRDEPTMRLVHRFSPQRRTPTAAASRSDLHGVSLRSRRTGRLRSTRRALAAVAKLAECSNRGGAMNAPDAAGGPIVRGQAPAEAGSAILLRSRATSNSASP